MKKLLIAAVAAMMSVAVSTVFADISIKGDAHFRYANIDADAGSHVVNKDGNNSTGQRFRLHVTGKAGNTTVKAGFRSDGGTRVSSGTQSSDGAAKEGSGGASDNLAAFNVDYLFLTTKIGGVTIKAGDWWDTTGLGLARKGRPNPDQVEISTKVADWKLTLETGADDSVITLGAEGKIGGFSVDLEHNDDDDGYSDIAIKGKVGVLGIAAEAFEGDMDDSNANLVHFWTTANGVTWHISRAEWDPKVNDITKDNSKFSPLGVSILGSAPGINGNLALINVNSSNKVNKIATTTGEGDVIGVRADMKVAGLGVQVAVGNLTLSTGDANAVKTGEIDETFKDIIITKPLGKGSKLNLSWGEWNDTTSAGAKISVKF